MFKEQCEVLDLLVKSTFVFILLYLVFYLVFLLFFLDIKESDLAVSLLSIDELTGAAVIPEIPHLQGIKSKRV